MSDKVRKIIQSVCAIVLIGFAAYYAYTDNICGTIFASLAMSSMIYLIK